MRPPAPLSRARPLQLASARTEVWLLGLFTLLLLGIGIGLRDPWPSDEPRFALVAHWMVAHGHWLFPHRGHELYPDKPPVFMWLQALAYLATRSWRVAFMLPSLLSGLLTVGLVYDLGRRLWNHRSGLLAALAMLVTVHFTYQMRRAQIDPLMVAWMTLANYGLLRHLLMGPAWRWFALGCFVAGVGVITKGVGVLALLMLVPFVFARRRGWRHVATIRGDGWRWAGSLALFLVPILAWLIPVLVVSRLDGDPQHAAYVHDILLGQTVHRYASPSGHIQPPYYFLGIIAADWLPLSLLLPWTIPAWWRRLKRRDARYLLPLLWVVLVVLFFSLSPGKRDVYILPALPMAALAMAPLLAGLLRRRAALLPVWLLTLALGAGLTAAAALALLRDPHWAQGMASKLDTTQLWWPMLAMGLAGLTAAMGLGIRRAALGWLAFSAALWSIYGLWAYPLLNGARSAADVMRRARAAAGPGITLGLVAWKEQNLLMARGPVREFGFLKPWPQQFDEAVQWLQADPAQRRLFVQQAAMPGCIDRARALHVGHANHRDWWLIGAPALPSGCRGVNGNAADNDDDVQ